MSRDIVTQTEPGELPLFQSISKQYFKRPAETPKNQSGKDEMLGFGIGETVPLLTPAVLVVMTQVVTFLTAVVKQSITEASASIISEQVKKMFKKFRQEESRDELAPAPLTLEQPGNFSGSPSACSPQPFRFSVEYGFALHPLDRVCARGQPVDIRCSAMANKRGRYFFCQCHTEL